MKTVYKAQPKQVMFHNAKADEVLFGGAAGGGKSYAILWDAVSKALEVPETRIVILRRTYPELEKSILYEFLNLVPSRLYSYHKNTKRATFKNKSVIEFDHCQHESDIYKFQSAQYDFIYIDELTHWTEFMYRYILSRLRTVKRNIKPQIKCASNPGNIGHHFVKTRFIDNAVPYEITQRYDPVNNAQFTTQFIPSKVYDNEYLVKTDYVRQLERLPEDERKALLLGDWNVFKGQFFKEWNSDIHVIEPFPIPQNWKRFRSLDWGFANPSAVLWYALDPKGNVYVYRELYVTKVPDWKLAKTIKELTGKEQIAYTVADPSLWSITQFERGESVALRIMRHGVSLIKADNNRVGGAAVVRSYLSYEKDDKTGKVTRPPKLRVFSTCINLIRTIPGLVYSQTNTEDVDTSGEDHCYDSLRYGLMSHPIPSKENKPPNPRQSFIDLVNEISNEKRRGYIGRI